LGDLRKRQTTPDLHHKYFTLLFRQAAQRGDDHVPTFVLFQWAGEPGLGLGTCCRPVPAVPSSAAPLPIQGKVLHGSVKVCNRVRSPILGAPKSNKRFLNDILGVNIARHPLPGKKNQGGTVLIEPNTPLIRTARHLPAPSAANASLQSRRRQAWFLSKRSPVTSYRTI